MKNHVSKFVASLLALPVLLIAGNLVHMPSSHAMTAMPSGQCQTSCTTSQTPADIATKPEDILKDKDIEPQPAEPYYLAFMGVGWTTILPSAAAYLIRSLSWRPPDLYKLNVVYRI